MKLFVAPETLRKDSYFLASKIVNDNFEPDVMIALWRGGAPIGCYVHEFLKYFNIQTDHIAIRTSRYTGIDETSPIVTVYNLGYLIKKLTKSSKVVLVDDIYDSGLSMEAVLKTLEERLGENMPTDIRIATVDYKPKRNMTKRIPNYFVNEIDEWVVYPHELEGLTIDEIRQGMGLEIADLIEMTKINQEKKLII